MNSSIENIDDLAQTLWDYHRLSQAPEKADCIVVFGGRDIRTAQRGAELFLGGFAPLMVMTGGYGHKTKGWSKSEAETFADIAVSMGVPAEKILVEKESANTGDNIIFTKKLLRDRGIEAKKIIAIQKPYTERRLSATLKKQWPEVESIAASIELSFDQYPTGGISKSDCINSMVSDVQKIFVYPERGFQVPIEVPSHVMEAYRKLIGLGFNKMLVK
ncbi:MAG: YdcF family protein [Candidatus Paceibacterota bacterium]|jgi:uncharacterized SAM-binding protein YcdF (DUF218 family)